MFQCERLTSSLWLFAEHGNTWIEQILLSFNIYRQHIVLFIVIFFLYPCFMKHFDQVVLRFKHNGRRSHLQYSCECSVQRSICRHLCCCFFYQWFFLNLKYCLLHIDLLGLSHHNFCSWFIHTWCVYMRTVGKKSAGNLSVCVQMCFMNVPRLLCMCERRRPSFHACHYTHAWMCLGVYE